MKKRIMFFLCTMLTLLPLGATAESLPEVLGAVSQGLSEGLSEGLQALSIPDQDLSLALDVKDTRLEEGRTLLLTITAGNPYPAAADVTLSLDLPERLSCAQPLTWTAQLAPAKADPKTGEPVPSTTTFTREVTLTPGSGESEQVELQAEMSMGVRFYRANAALELCVPLISADAALEGVKDGQIEPGDAFELALCIVNDGAAPKDVTLSYLMPDGVSPAADLPAGFSLKHRTIVGAVRAEAASSVSILVPLHADDDALMGDADASRMVSGVLTIDGKRVSTPMLQIVGPMISAKLIPETTSLEEGRTMDLSITVVNTGLAAADVELSCLLPDGLSVVEETKTRLTAAEKEEKRIATEDEADDSLLPAAAADDGGVPPAAAAESVMSEAVLRPQTRKADGALVYAIHMDAATKTDGGVAAASKEIRLRVRADMPMENAGDRLLGASLAWRTDGGDTQLSEAAALRVQGQGFLGLNSGEWNGILLAALLMLVTICCLYSAVRSDSKQDDYCFE